MLRERFFFHKNQLRTTNSCSIHIYIISKSLHYLPYLVKYTSMPYHLSLHHVVILLHHLPLVFINLKMPFRTFQNLSYSSQSTETLLSTHELTYPLTHSISKLLCLGPYQPPYQQSLTKVTTYHETFCLNKVSNHFSMHWVQHMWLHGWRQPRFCPRSRSV